MPGPGRFEIEVLDADPRRVKKLKIYRSLDRPGAHDRDGRRRTAGRRPRCRAAPRRPPATRPARSPATRIGQALRPTQPTIEIRTPAVTLTRLAHSIVLAWGWRRALIAFARRRARRRWRCRRSTSWPVPFLTFPILVWLVDGAAAGRLGGASPAAAIAGWWFGFGYFLAGLYWVGYAFLVDAKTFGWLLPFAVIALPAGMALLHRARPRAGAAALDARRRARAGARGRAHRRGMAARPSAQRLSWNAFGYALDLAARRWRRARR